MVEIFRVWVVQSFLTSQGNLTLLMVCSEPLSSLAPQWKWNCFRRYVPVMGPPVRADLIESRRTQKLDSENVFRSVLITFTGVCSIVILIQTGIINLEATTFSLLCLIYQFESNLKCLKRILVFRQIKSYDMSCHSSYFYFYVYSFVDFGYSNVSNS